ncbi:MAG: peptidoglycan editing factor PgeF [Elusimicrobiota bacterium]
MVEIIKSNLLEKTNIQHGFSKKLKDYKDLSLNIPVFLLNQKHTDNIIFLNDYNMLTQKITGDSIITNLKNVAIAIKTADCLPILIADKNKNFVSCVHSGWRGTAKNIAGKSVMEIKKNFSVSDENIVVAIGPSICKNCYIVRNDVIDEIRKIIDFKFYHEIDNEHFKIDLKEINVHLLIKEGIKPENIDIINDCTYCKNDEYQSFRYHKNTNFYQLSFIYL